MKGVGRRGATMDRGQGSGQTPQDQIASLAKSSQWAISTTMLVRWPPLPMNAHPYLLRDNPQPRVSVCVYGVLYTDLSRVQAAILDNPAGSV